MVVVTSRHCFNVGPLAPAVLAPQRDVKCNEKIKNKAAMVTIQIKRVSTGYRPTIEQAARREGGVEKSWRKKRQVRQATSKRKTQLCHRGGDGTVV